MAVDDRGPGLRTFAIVMIILTIVTIILRFWSRAVSKSGGYGQRYSKYWWDDWTALMTLPIMIIYLSLKINTIALGIGRHIDTVPPPNVTQILKIILVSEMIYNLSITLPKISALLFYTRIFGTSSKFLRCSLGIIYFCIFGWLVALMLFSIFSCNPVKKQWEPTIPGHCYSVAATNLGSAIPSVVIDLLILLLPLPMIWNIQMSKSRKVLVAGVLLCGYCVIIISLGRLITVIKTETQVAEDSTFAIVPLLYWTSAEAPVSLLSVSLPSIFFLIRRAFREGVMSLFTFNNSTTKSRIRGDTAIQPSGDHVLQVKNNRFHNGSGDGAHELNRRQSFDSGENILPLVPAGPQYQVYVSKTPSNGSSSRPSQDQIRVRSEVHVKSENIV